MRGLVVAVVAFAITFGSVPSSWAWFGMGEKKKAAPAEELQPQKAEKASPAAAKAAPAKAKSKAAEEKDQKAREEAYKARMEQVNKKKQQLDNTEWQIELVPMAGKGKKEADTVLFRDGKVGVNGFEKRGFGMSNYSVNFLSDGTITVWETMQTSEKSGLVFLRGELDEKMTTMRGVLSHKIDDKTSEDFSFQSTGKRSVGAPAAIPATVKR